jgi:hypothetical protein
MAPVVQLQKLRDLEQAEVAADLEELVHTRSESGASLFHFCVATQIPCIGLTYGQE